MVHVSFHFLTRTSVVDSNVEVRRCLFRLVPRLTIVLLACTFSFLQKEVRLSGDTVGLLLSVQRGTSRSTIDNLYRFVF
jgi:hypothetical protein